MEKPYDELTHFQVYESTGASRTACVINGKLCMDLMSSIFVCMTCFLLWETHRELGRC